MNPNCAAQQVPVVGLPVIPPMIGVPFIPPVVGPNAVLPVVVVEPVIPSIDVIVPSQLLGADFLPTETRIRISEGTSFMMEDIMGTLVSQTGNQCANQGQTRRIIWSTGTIFYLNNNARNQCVINQG